MCRRLSILVSLILVLSLFLTCTAKADLIGWYRLDDGSGTTAVDSSSYGNDGTLQGTTKWVAGYYGGAIELNGSGDWVEINGIADDLTDNDFSVSAWIKTTMTGDGNVIGSNDSGSGHDFIFGVDGGNLLVEADSLNTYPPAINDDEWHFIAYVRNGTTAYAYTDGELVGTETPSGNPAGQARWSIGQEWDTNPSDFYGGLVDDVHFFSHPLTETEILTVMTGEGYPKASRPDPTDDSYLEDTWVSLSWRAGDFAVSHDVYFGESFDDVDNGTGETFRANQTSTFYIVGFPGFPYPDGLVPGTTYYWRIDEVNDAEPNSPWKGDIWSFKIPPRTAYNPDPADGSQVADTAAQLKWTKGFGGKLHTVYFGTDYDTVSNAAGGIPQGTTTYNPGALQAEKVYYWRVDEFDAPTTHKGDVWGFSSPGAVGNPSPANGATDAQMTGKLSWTAAATAVSHDVYFGTDKDAVRNATKASPEFKGNKALGSESLDPGKLAWQSDYYWRVDAVYNAGPVKGLVWGFTTADFIAV
ncbi:MAG: LamG domain-containing protein, partial [Planctomycetota bacterium]